MGRADGKSTLLILGKAGFGQDWPWHSPAAGSGGGESPRRALVAEVASAEGRQPGRCL